MGGPDRPPGLDPQLAGGDCRAATPPGRDSTKYFQYDTILNVYSREKYKCEQLNFTYYGKSTCWLWDPEWGVLFASAYTNLGASR